MVTIRRFDNQVQSRVGSPALARGAEQFQGGQYLAQGLQDVGTVAFEWQDEIDTADAKKADADFTNKVNSLLYDPDAGYLNARGSGAINSRQPAVEGLEKARDSILGAMSPSARRKAEASLRTRYEQAANRINDHFSTERRGYLNEAASARIEASVSSAIADPTSIPTQIGVATRELADIAAREGWSPEKLQQERAKVADNVYTTTIERMSRVDPETALQFAAENKDKMSGAALAQVEQRLVPLAKERLGRNRALAAMNGGSLKGAMTLARDTLGMDENEQRETLAAYLADGGQNIDPAKTAWCAAFINATLAKAGMGGTGSLAARSFLNWGEEVDQPQRGDVVVLSRGDPNGPQGHVGFFDGFNDDGTIRLLGGNQGDKVSLQGYDTRRVLGYRRAGGGGGQGSVTEAMRAAAAEPDPIIRDSMMQTISLNSKILEREESEALEGAMTAAYQMIQAGGSVSDLDYDTSQTLAGPPMSNLLAYERTVRAGQEITTDTGKYVDLMRMSIEEPQAFLEEDKTSWLNSLSKSDFAAMEKRQADMRGGLIETSTAPKRTDLLSSAELALSAAGFTKKDKPAEVADFQYQLVKWAQENPDVANDEVKRQDKINRMLVEITTDATYRDGLWNQKTRPLFQVDLDGRTRDTEDDLTQDQIDRMLGAGGLQIGGETVTSDEAAAVYNQLLAAINGLDIRELDPADPSLAQPTAQQLIEALAANRR